MSKAKRSALAASRLLARSALLTDDPMTVAIIHASAMAPTLAVALAKRSRGFVKILGESIAQSAPMIEAYLANSGLDDASKKTIRDALVNVVAAYGADGPAVPMTQGHPVYAPAGGWVPSGPPPNDAGEIVIRPMESTAEFADRTEIRVHLAGVDPAKITLTKSDAGYFIDAVSALPVMEYLAEHSLPRGVYGPSGVPMAPPTIKGTLVFRGSLGICRACVTVTGEPVVSWDAAKSELVMTYAKADVVPVSIAVPPTVTRAEVDAAMANAERALRASDTAEVMRLATGDRGVGVTVPNGQASDEAGKVKELTTYLATLSPEALHAVLLDVRTRYDAAYPKSVTIGPVYPPNLMATPAVYDPTNDPAGAALADAHIAAAPVAS